MRVTTLVFVTVAGCISSENVFSAQTASLCASQPMSVTVSTNGQAQNLQPGSTGQACITGESVALSVALSTGQSVLLRSSGVAVNSTADSATPDILMEGIRPLCADGSDTHKGYNWTTQNNVGPELTVQNRFLYTAAVAGTVTYTCTLQGVLNVPNDSDISDSLIYQPATSSGAFTYLKMTSPMAAGAAFSWGTGVIVDGEKIGSPSDSEFLSSGDSETVHLGAVDGVALPAGVQRSVLGSARYAMPSADEDVDVIGDVALTVCYEGTGSCPAYAQGPIENRPNGAVVSTQLIVHQYNAANATTPCAIFKDPDSAMQTTISKSTHHKKVFHEVKFVRDVESCGSGPAYFDGYINVHWLDDSGHTRNPVRVEPGYYSQGYSVGIMVFN